MTKDEIEALSEEEVLDLMRREGLEVVHSMFATIHYRSDARPNGYTGDDLDKINRDLESGDLRRWRSELAAHFERKG